MPQTTYVLPHKRSGIARMPRTVSAFFNLTPADIKRDGMLDTVTGLGLAVKMQVGRTPRPDQSFPLLRDAWDAETRPNLTYLAENNIDLIASGDDFAREDYMRAALDDLDWAKTFVGYVAATIRETVPCHFVALVDESNTKLEGWLPRSFVVPWRAAGGAPEAMPSLIHPSPLEFPQWSRLTYRQPNWWSMRSLRRRIERIIFMTRNPPAGVPLAAVICTIRQTSVVQPNGVPLVSFGGIGPRDITAQSIAAIGCGASYLDYFGYDWHEWRRQRELNVPGSHLHTGIRPGDPLWAEFEATQALIRSRQPAFADETFVPVETDDWACFRRGRRAIGINWSDRALPAPRGPGMIPPGGVWFGDRIQFV